jgi:nucleoside-diphosphate-sugar epimerase
LKRCLVTGAAGFIGSSLVHRLKADGCFVRALAHREPVREISADEAVAGDLAEGPPARTVVERIDTVFHLAGRTHALSEVGVDETEYRRVNVDGTRHLLAAGREAGVERFVFFSSVKAAGEGGLECLDESVEPRPTTAYGRTKLEAERLVIDYGARFGVHAVCLRLPMVYGPGNKGNIHRMIDWVARGYFPPLPEVGNRRSILHVDNAVEAACLAAVHPAASGQTYIVTDGRPYSSRELYELICKGLGRTIPGWSVPLPVLRGLARAGDVIGHVRGRRFFFDSDALEKLIGSAWYSSEKVSRELGYRPSVTFEEALPELILWYRKGQG